MKLLKLLNIGFLIVIISTGLINTETFYSPTAFAYYGFCIITLFFVIISSLLNSTINNNVILKVPLLLFGLWCCYALFQYFTNTATLVFTIYCVVLYFLLLQATKLFSIANFNFSLFFIGIAIIASMESWTC